VQSGPDDPLSSPELPLSMQIAGDTEVSQVWLLAQPAVVQSVELASTHAPGDWLVSQV